MRIFLVTFLLLFSSCNKESKTEYFEAWLVNNWLGVKKVESLLPDAFFPERSIVKPQMTWKPILKVDSYKESWCLFYRIPHKRLNKGRGIIRVIKKRLGEDCSRTLDKVPEIEIDGITHLKIYFTSRSEKNIKLKTEYKPFRLYISFNRLEDKDLALSLPLVNVEAKDLINKNKLHRKLNKYKRYDEPWKETLYPGLKIYSGNFNPKRPVAIDGDLPLNYSQNFFKYCYQVDKECKVVKEFNCGECERGWYSIVDHACPGGGSKLCGPSLCGGKNQPACPRGESYSSLENDSLCYRGSVAGICQKGLETYCDENKILVCR